MATKVERQILDLANTEALLVKANTALSDILDSQLENYDIENMDTRQRATNLKIKELENMISSLERKRDKLYESINGVRRTVSLRNRR